MNKCAITGLLIASSGFSLGAISVTENFDNALEVSATQPRVFGFSTSILGWGESNIDTESGPQRFSDFIGDTSTEGGGGGSYTPVGGSGATAGLGNNGTLAGYLYRELGTIGSDNQLIVGVDNYWRADSSQRNTLLVEIYTLPAGDAFTFAEFGNDIAVTGTLLDSFVAGVPATAGAVLNTSETIDATTVASDARVFIRLSNSNNGPTANQPVHLDNVTVQSSFIPEPSSFALLCLSLGGLTLRRRRA